MGVNDTFKGNTTQVAGLAVLYDFEPPIRINISRSNHTTNRFRSYQGNTMKYFMSSLVIDIQTFHNFMSLIVNINEYQTTEE